MKRALNLFSSFSREKTAVDLKLKDPRIRVVQGDKPTQAIQNSCLVEAGDLVRTWQDLQAELAGVGPKLANLVYDRKVSDILINKPGETWVDRGEGLERLTTGFETGWELRALAIRLAAACGKRLDDACPIVDGTLPGGIRLHAVLPPLALPYPLISLRCPRAKGISFQELIQAGTIANPIAALLRKAITKPASTFISGATGSGKTTLLSSLLELVPANERIVCIEEVAELRPDHPHVVHLQERMKNVQGSGAVPMSELVRAAMRMRPDRIVLGECRGAEVREVLSAMNTGHQGAWATVHANAVQDVPSRLVALGSLAQMPPATVSAQVVSGVDLFIHVRRQMLDGKAKRWLSQLGIPRQTGDNLAVDLAVEIDVHGQIRTGMG